MLPLPKPDPVPKPEPKLPVLLEPVFIIPNPELALLGSKVPVEFVVPVPVLPNPPLPKF